MRLRVSVEMPRMGSDSQSWVVACVFFGVSNAVRVLSMQANHHSRLPLFATLKVGTF